MDEAFAPMAVSITLEDDIDVSRGDMIVRANNTPELTKDMVVMLCWLGNTPFRSNTKYSLQHTSNKQSAMIREIIYKIDINTLGRQTENTGLKMNDIAKVKISTANAIMVDSYQKNRYTGSIILIDNMTNETVAAGMIV